MQKTNLEKLLCLTSEQRNEIKRNTKKKKTCLQKSNLLVSKGKNPSFVSNAISDELQSRSYFPVNISKALISTNIILKMFAAASSFLTCKSMRSLFTQTCQQKQFFLVFLPLKKVREEVGAYSKGGGLGGGRFFDIMNREQALIRGRALIRAWALSRGNTVFIIYNLYCEQTSSYLKYLMNSCIWHNENSILRLLHYIVILLIAKIFT